MPIEDFAQLKGKKFAIMENHKHDHIFFNYYMLQNNITLNDNFFSEVIPKSSHSQVTLSVFLDNPVPELYLKDVWI